MPPRDLVRAFVILWWTLGIAILVLSVDTLRNVLGAAGPASHHVALLAAVEAIAAVCFLVPATIRVGAVGLMLVFAVAILVHAGAHQFRWDLLIDAAGVLFVAVHGPLTREQWGLALGRAD